MTPLLANIVLNHLDWRLHEAGYRFAGYADDFVVVCQTKWQAQEARTFVQHVLETDLELKLSPEKTKITTFGKGYDFLGFTLSSTWFRWHDDPQMLRQVYCRFATPFAGAQGHATQEHLHKLCSWAR